MASEFGETTVEVAQRVPDFGGDHPIRSMK